MFDAVGMVGYFASWSYLFGTSDDDWIDRINHIWTVTLLGLFSIAITSGQYILGNPIQCWTPAELKEQFILYTHSTCWISNTYYVPIYEEIPDDISERQEAEMTYYQWVPIILLFQALLFKIPNITWRLLSGYSGIRMDKMTALAEDTVMSPPDDREKKIKLMAKYIDSWILTQQNYKHNLVVHLRHKISSICCFCFGKREGTFLTGYYLFIKFLYCVNVIGQFFLLNEFMAMDYNNFGFQIIQYYIKHGEWSESPRFPRVTLCDFIIRQITNQQRYTVQCVMPLNLLNEKIFVFQWFWLFILATLTCLNFVSWIYYVSSQENNFWYIKKHLKICKEIHSRNDVLLARMFTQEHLRDDGVFVLRVLEKNSSTFITSDLILNLWTIFRQRHYEKVKMITQTENADLGVDIGDSI